MEITHTFRTVITPSCVSFCVTMSNISLPSPSIMRYSSSAFLPMSASEAFMVPMAVPTGEDSGIRRWTEPVKKKQSEIHKHLLVTNHAGLTAESHNVYPESEEYPTEFTGAYSKV